MTSDETNTSIDGNVAAFDRVGMQLREIDRLGRGVNLSLGTAFADLAIKGRSFEAVLSTLALRLSKLTLNAAFKPLEQSLSSGLGSLFSGTPFTSDTFGSGIAASGSPFNASQAVGPTYAQPITVNISTPDVESFRRSETQLAAVLARSVARGSRNL